MSAASRWPTPWRLTSAMGGLILLAALFVAWDVRPGTDDALSAWQTYESTDLILATLTALALAGVAFAERAWGQPVTAAAAGLAALVTVRAMQTGDPLNGAKYALLGAAIALIGAAWPGWRALRDRHSKAPEELPRPAREALQAYDRVRPHAVRVLTSSFVLGIPIALGGLPFVPMDPGGGTDGSWITALHVAAHEGITFGTDFVYTYGPLGYLTVPRTYYQDLVQQGYAYVVLAYYGAAVSILSAARRSFPLIAAALLTLVALQCFRLVSPDEQTQFAVVVASFAWGLTLLRSPALRASRWFYPLLALSAVFAAFESLIKLNSGLTIVLILGIVAAVARRRPLAGLAVFGGTFVAALLVFWAIFGGPLSALPDYLRNSLEIISGYAQYQYTEEEGRSWEYVGALLAMALLGFGTWRASADLGGRARLGMTVITALTVFSLWKQGFVRHDGHSLAFFAGCYAIGLSLGWPRRDGGLRYLALAVLAVLFLAAARAPLHEFTRPFQTYQAFRDTIERIQDVDTAAWQQHVAQTEEVPEEALALVRGHSFHAFPSEAALSFAFPDLEWAPLPVIQGFQAYTAELDALNAERLADEERGPDRILRTTEYSPFEDPETVMELACRFRELYAGKKWQVLGRGSDRCGEPRLLERRTVEMEETFPVPSARPDELVYVRILGWGPSLFERARTFLWKAYDRNVILGDEEFTARVAQTLADKRQLLTVPERYDYTGQFELSKDPAQMRLRMTTEQISHGITSLDRDVTVEFYAVPLSDLGVAEPGAPA